jgi:DNA replication protein DnaC
VIRADEREDVLDVMEACVVGAFEAAGAEPPQRPFPHLTYADAMLRYGSDKPDLRFGLEIQDATEVTRDSEFGVFENAPCVRYVVVPRTFSRSEQARLEEERQRYERQKRADKYRVVFPRDTMGDLIACTLDNFERRPGTESALTVAQRYVDSLPEPDPPGLMFWGDVGNGKTHLAAAIVNAADAHTMGVAWVHIPSWLRYLGELNQDPGRRASQIDYASTADLLVMDELGASKLTASRAEWLLSVLDARCRNKLPTVITTNKNRLELEKALTVPGDGTEPDVPDGARLVSRIVGMSLLVENKGADFRLEQAARRMQTLRGGQANVSA